MCPGWTTKGEIRKGTGFGQGRVNRANARLKKARLIEEGKEDRPRNKGCQVFRKSIHAATTPPTEREPGEEEEPF